MVKCFKLSSSAFLQSVNYVLAKLFVRYFFPLLQAFKKMNNTQMLNISSEGLSTTTADAFSTAIGVMYGVIAALSFLLNFLFSVIMIRKPAMLKRPHSILLFSLAITDLLTGW